MSFLFGGTAKRAMDDSWYTNLPDSTGSDEATATTLGPVFASIRHLVDYISTLPADFERVEAGKTVKVGVPELVRNVDTEFGWTTWIGQAVYSLIVHGNSVGKVTAFSGWALPTMVRWAGRWSGGDDGLGWFVDGVPLPDTMVAHIPWIVPPGKRLGLSPIEHYASIVNAGLSAQDYADVKRGGGLPPSILKNSQKTITAEVAAAASSKAATAFATGKPFVTGTDWDLTIPTIPPNHAQFIETLNLSANQIAAIYGIDPREIGGTGAAGSITYVNDESRALNRAANARPYIIRLENAISRMLPNATRMRLNLNAGIRADIKTRTEVDTAKIADGRLSVNEARAHDDLDPIPGGDFHNVPTPAVVEPTQRKDQP